MREPITSNEVIRSFCFAIYFGSHQSMQIQLEILSSSIYQKNVGAKIKLVNMNLIGVFSVMGLRSIGKAGRTSGFFRASATASKVPPLASVTVERAQTTGDSDADSGSVPTSNTARSVLSTCPNSSGVSVPGQRSKEPYPYGLSPKFTRREPCRRSAMEKCRRSPYLWTSWFLSVGN